jgi:hypothetical protein
MPAQPDWIPPGWTACDPDCEPPKTETPPGGTTQIYCKCVDACLNVGRCGCRLVRRKKIERDESQPDGWDLGPPEMVEITCETRAPYDSTYLYRCLCLEREAASRSRDERRPEQKAD